MTMKEQTAANNSPKPRARRYPEEVKNEAIRLVVELNLTYTEAGRSTGIHPQTLSGWVRSWKRENPQHRSKTGTVSVQELEKENIKLRRENEFLKKAAAFFARTLD